MRLDMAKVLVERPRLPPRDARGRDGRIFRDSSDAPFLPMKAGYRDTKSLNDNLQPLARFLARQVGRPWDAVYRDIRSVIDGRNVVQRHILEHVDDYVARQVAVVDGHLIDRTTRRYGLSCLWQPLYVDPRTGLLRRNPAAALRQGLKRADRQEREAKRKAIRRDLSPSHQLHRLNGEWFSVEIAPRRAFPAAVWDAVQRCRVAEPAKESRRTPADYDAEALYGRRDVYAVSKRQLSALEIRVHGLRE